MSYYESNNSGWPSSRAGWDRSGATTFQRPHASNQPDLTVRYAASMKTEDTAFGSQLDGMLTLCFTEFECSLTGAWF